MPDINQVTLTGRVAQPPRRVPRGGFVFSLFQEQAYGAREAAVPIYPVIFGWGEPPSFLRVNQSVIVVGRVRTRNFDQNVRRVVARALARQGQRDGAAVAAQVPAGLHEPRVAIEIVADRIALSEPQEESSDVAQHHHHLRPSDR
jgi:hypothetical protein